MKTAGIQVEFFQYCLSRFALQRTEYKFPFLISSYNKLNTFVAEVANPIEKQYQLRSGTHDPQRYHYIIM